MNLTRFLGRWATAMVLVIATVAPCLAEGPTAQIKETTDKILGILTNPALKGPAMEAERRKLIRKAADERFDWKEMARLSLGIHWNHRTQAEKEEFVDLFSRLLEQAYMGRIENYSGEKVEYKGENIQGDYGSVRVGILTKEGQEIPVEYMVRKEGNQWLVYDVIIEGASLVHNYRSQFDSILLNSSFGDLMKRIKAKVASYEEGKT